VDVNVTAQRRPRTKTQSSIISAKFGIYTTQS
jgi:hypothetical protein